MVTAQPSEEVMWSFAKIYGSYFGEVMRRAHGLGESLLSATKKPLRSISL